MTKSRHIRRPRKLWTDGQISTLRRLYPNTDTAALARKLGRTVLSVYQGAQKFGIGKSAAYMRKKRAIEATRLSESGAAHRFVKGQEPANKGLRRPGWAPGRMAETQFKAGNRSGQAAKNWKPIGSHRTSDDGYVYRKITDTGYPPRDWQPVNRLIWVEARGRIPAGHTIAFKAGKRTMVLEEITLDRLELVSRAELMRRNSYHTNMPKELAQIVQLRGAINRQINRRRKALEEQN